MNEQVSDKLCTSNTCASPSPGQVFDTDANGLVDALETIASFSLLARMTIKDKLDVIFSLYDFNSAGQISVDELVILSRTVIMGAAKMDRSIHAPGMSELESLAAWAFQRADKDGDGEMEKHEFDAFCLGSPCVAAFLNYWAGASHQVRCRTKHREQHMFASFFARPLLLVT